MKLKLIFHIFTEGASGKADLQYFISYNGYLFFFSNLLIIMTGVEIKGSTATMGGHGRLNTELNRMRLKGL